MWPDYKSRRVMGLTSFAYDSEVKTHKACLIRSASQLMTVSRSIFCSLIILISCQGQLNIIWQSYACSTRINRQLQHNVKLYEHKILQHVGHLTIHIRIHTAQKAEDGNQLLPLALTRKTPNKSCDPKQLIPSAPVLLCFLDKASLTAFLDGLRRSAKEWLFPRFCRGLSACLDCLSNFSLSPLRKAVYSTYYNVCTLSWLTK